MTTPSLRAVVALALSLTASVVHAQDSGLSTSVGLEYSTGDYGGTLDTDIIAVPFSARYELGPWRFQATLPYLRLKGPGDVIPDIGRVDAVKGRRKGRPGTPSANTRSSESGIGDLLGEATYRIGLNGHDGLMLDLTGKIKLATADEDKGLGTGEHDFSFQVDALKGYAGDLVLKAGLGYAVLGDSDAIPVDNHFFAHLGASYKVADPLSAGLTFAYREKASSAGDERMELKATLDYPLDNNLAIQGYVLKGFADGGPSFGFGAYVRWAF